MRDLLLLSSSRSHPYGYLEHAHDAIAAWAGDVTDVLFVPWALADHAAYTASVADALAPLGLRVDSIADATDPVRAIFDAEAIFVGGGNTFRLLDTLQHHTLLWPIRHRVSDGALRYLGASAGTNVACPTIRTTNDMPIRWPRGSAALGLVPFQINAHYVDADPGSTHKGETRLQRLAEFHEENTAPVVALREHAWVRVVDGDMTVGGLDDDAGLLLRPQQPAVLLQRGPLDLR